MIQLVDSEGPDQTAEMCKLIWALTVRHAFSQVFYYENMPIQICWKFYH